MQLAFHSAVIITKDIKRLSAFYRDVLGQEIEFDLGNCTMLKCGLSLWQLHPEYPILKYRQKGFYAGGNKNLELCFETDDFERIVLSLERQNLQYLHPVITEKWGQRTIRFYDPDDNLIEVGESMPCFVRRLTGQGLSEKGVAEKTGLSIATIKTCLQTK